MPPDPSLCHTADFQHLFTAKSVAIVGASPNSERITGRPQRFLYKHGYGGEIYPVNPNHEEIDGLRCYDSVLDVDGEIDVALILVPSKYVTTVLKECGRKGIPFNIISSSGYGELGEEGRELEQELLAIAETYGIRILGPNSIGFFNVAGRVPISFATPLDRYDTIRSDEGLAFVTQSGAYGGMLFTIAQEMQIGTQYWISTGNEVDVDAIEIIDYLLTDPNVSMIVAYIESFKRSARLRSVCRKAHSLGKPIVVFTVGQSVASRQAVSSHTGKMTAAYAVTSAVLRDFGVVHVETVTEFRDVLSTYFSVPEIPSRTSRWGVLTTSGGAGALIADLIHRNEMPLASLSTETERALGEIIPDYGAIRNPVDTTGNIISDPDLYERSITVLAADPGVDVLVLQFGNTGDVMGERYADLIARVARNTETVLVAVFTGNQPPIEVRRSYRAAGIAVVEDPARFIRSIDLLAPFVETDASDLVEQSMLDQSPTVDLEPDATWDEIAEVCREFDIPLAEGAAARSASEAADGAISIGFPVVLKATGALKHKTEADAIVLDLADSAAVEQAYETVTEAIAEHDPTADTQAVLVQAFEEGDLELIVGIIVTDYGPVMSFGWGGIYVEIIEDIVYKPLPITPDRARALIEQTAVGEVLAGYRGREDVTDSVVSLLVGASKLYEAGEFDELEFNPVIVTKDGPVVVDVLLS